MSNSIKQNSYTLADILGMPLSKAKAEKLLQQDSGTYDTYLNFSSEHQAKLLSFIQGENGLCITYDTFFKKVFNPSVNPKRLEKFLSAILKQRVKIKAVIPKEGEQLVEAGSLVIMDIIVELENGSIMDVEIQKVGYKFSGERSTCYLSDFIMRQYNRVKSEKGRDFSYSDLKPVYLIVIMESSPLEFRHAAPEYLHMTDTTLNTGIKLNFLTKTIFISLDTFHSVVHNISNELEAWLTFLSSDDPERIVQLVNTFPEFLSCYQDIVKFRQNPKELIHMYSEALTILDRNTALLMCDEMTQTIQQQNSTIQQQNIQLSESEKEIAALRAEIERLKQK